MDHVRMLENAVTRPSVALLPTMAERGYKRKAALEDGDLVLVVGECEFTGLTCRIKPLKRSSNVDLILNGVRIGTVADRDVRRLPEQVQP